MKSFRPRKMMIIFLSLLLLFISTGCGRISGETNYVLKEGETVSGTLFLFSKNATLEKDSNVSGSVVMICCNLTIDGNVSGNVFLVTGNLWVTSYGDVDGDVNVISANVIR